MNRPRRDKSWSAMYMIVEICMCLTASLMRLKRSTALFLTTQYNEAPNIHIGEIAT